MRPTRSALLLGAVASLGGCTVHHDYLIDRVDANRIALAEPDALGGIHIGGTSLKDHEMYTIKARSIDPLPEAGGIGQSQVVRTRSTSAALTLAAPLGFIAIPLVPTSLVVLAETGDCDKNSFHICNNRTARDTSIGLLATGGVFAISAIILAIVASQLHPERK